MERYNLSTNEIFPTPNSSLPLFVQTIEIDSREQVEHLENIRYGRIVPDELRDAVPLFYDRFQVPTLGDVITIFIQK